MRKFLIMGLVVAGLAAASPAFAFENGGQDQRGERAGHRGEMLRHIDKDGDGAINKSEFLASAEERFARMDKNGDGRITPDERPQRREHGGREGGRGDAPPFAPTEHEQGTSNR